MGKVILLTWSYYFRVGYIIYCIEFILNNKLSNWMNIMNDVFVQVFTPEYENGEVYHTP